MSTHSRKMIGKRLQQLRKRAGYRSAASFAAALGVKTNTYTTYEQGKASFSYERAWEMADLLGVSLDELGGREWPPGGARSLTGEERSLVDSFRAATPRERYALITTAEAFRDGGLAKNNQDSKGVEERRA